MNEQKSVLKIGIAGLGVVGGEVARQLTGAMRRLARQRDAGCSLLRFSA